MKSSSFETSGCEGCTSLVQVLKAARQIHSAEYTHFMIKALRNRSIRLLWGGQALSAIGDEIYRVALIWMAVNMIGADTGYLAAAQMAALLTLSLIGGKWADHWDHSKTMIWVDALRSGIVLIPVIVFQFTPISLPLLLGVAITLSGLGAFFDPALQASLPRYARDLPTLRAANGLMSTTMRLARVVGPGIIGALTSFIPTLHFFTLDAVSFAASAISIHALAPPPEHHAPVKKIPRAGFRETLASGFIAARRIQGMQFLIFSKAIIGGSWNLAYGLGIALVVHKLAPHDVRAYGLVIAAYGIGNVTSALIIGNLSRARPILMIFSGYIWLAVGFIWISLTHNLPALMVATAFTAVGGPMNDLPFVDLVQSRFELSDMPKVFRLRMATETGASLVGMLVSPFLFRMYSTSAVIASCGGVILVAALAILFRMTRGHGVSSSPDSLSL